jgi:hypothetical protein
MAREFKPAELRSAAPRQRRATDLRVALDDAPVPAGSRKAAANVREIRFTRPRSLAQSILEKNRPVQDALVQSLRSSMGVIPFVGAGLSAPFKFPQWGDLLKQLAGPAQKTRVERLVRESDFEGAAELLYERGRAADRLQEGIASSFDRQIPSSEFAGKAVALLPYLTAGPVITTNYDRVLEHAFDLANRPFTRSIVGAEPDELVPAIQRNERVLFKIHGDCETRRGLTLTLQSYDLAYGHDRASGRQARDKLQGMLPILLTNRPFLFLGCSLETDRTLEAVKATYKQHARIGHYAILAADDDADAFDKRQDALADIGIRVLWYMPGMYAEIRALLRGLLEATSVDLLKGSPAPSTTRSPAPAIPPAARAAPTNGTLELPPALRERIRSGNVIYFLGAGASGPLLGAEFYEDIRRNNNIPNFVRSRADIAQHLVDRNARSTLVSEIVDVMRKQFPKPSDIHQRFAALPDRMRAVNRAEPRLILITTNYDRGLESAFEERGAPHHLFVYQPHGAYEGRFIHRTPAGEIRVIVRPENLHELEDVQPVIVKMNGGPGLAPPLPDSFSVATRDFYQLAARIPGALPAFLVPELAVRSLLFLVHGLKEPDVEEVIRFRCAQKDVGRSWALKWRPNATAPDPSLSRYWEQVGVDLLWGQIDACMTSIEQAIAS